MSSVVLSSQKPVVDAAEQRQNKEQSNRFDDDRSDACFHGLIRLGLVIGRFDDQNEFLGRGMD